MLLGVPRLNGYYWGTSALLKRNKRGLTIKPLKNVLGNNTEFFGFRLFFLGKEDLDVEVIEVNEIDFNDLKRQLKNGKSVFMTAIPEAN